MQGIERSGIANKENRGTIQKSRDGVERRHDSVKDDLKKRVF